MYILSPSIDLRSGTCEPRKYSPSLVDLPGFSESGEFRADRVRSSGGSGGGGTIRVLLVRRRTGYGRGATLSLPDRLMVSRGRRWRGVPHEVAKVANAAGSDRKASQAILFQHGTIWSGHISKTRLLDTNNRKSKKYKCIIQLTICII